MGHIKTWTTAWGPAASNVVTKWTTATRVDSLRCGLPACIFVFHFVADLSDLMVKKYIDSSPVAAVAMRCRSAHLEVNK